MILSKPGSALKANNLFEEALRRVKNGDSTSFVLVVPTASFARDMERRLLHSIEGRSICSLTVHTISTFASCLLNVGRPNLRLISDAESSVFIEESIRELFERDELRYFEQRSDVFSGDPRPLPLARGTFEMVLNTIRQLKQNGIYPDQMEKHLAAAIRRTGETTDVRRAGDILRIYSSYECRLEQGFVDTYGLLQKLNARYDLTGTLIDEAFSDPVDIDLLTGFPGVRDVFFEGFYRMERPALELVEKVGRAASVRSFIRIEAPEVNDELFSGSTDLLNNLIEKGFETVAEGSSTRTLREEYLAQTLFCKSVTDTPEVADDIHLWSASNPEKEVDAILRQIKVISSTTNCDLSKIAVLTFQPADYTALFRGAFDRFGVPANIIDRHKLDSSPLMLSVLAILEVAARGLRKQDIIRALVNPYLIIPTENGRNIDGSNLRRLIHSLHLAGDASHWKRALEARLLILEEREKELAEFPDEHEQRQLERDRANAFSAINDIESIERLIKPFTTQLTPRNFLKKLRQLLQSLELGRQMLKTSDATIAASSLELDTRSYRSFNSLAEDLEGIFSMMGLENEALPISFYVERLRTASIWTRFNPRPSHGAVYVASVEQALGMEFDYIFIAGLVDGQIPSVYEPMVFLSDSLQKGERRQLLEDRLSFYRAITTHRKELYLTYPSRDSNGVELAPSTFVSALISTITPKRDDCPPILPEAVFNRNDLFLHAGALLKQNNVGAAFGEFSQASQQFQNILTQEIPFAVRMGLARESDKDSEFAGIIDRAKLAQDELQYLDAFTRNVWSISQLELYATCPFKYFSEYVLRLNTEDIDEEGFDPREQGSFLHEVLREFFTRRRDSKAVALQDLDPHGLDLAITEIRTIADRKLADEGVDHPFWRLDSEFAIGLSNDQGVFERFVRKEKELEPLKTRAKYFEVSFGGSTGSKREADTTLLRDAPVDLGGLKLRGKIDRIDVAENDKFFAVIDYKSGKATRKLNDIKRGVSLQLPLYLRVAEDLLRSYFDGLEGVAALYHKLKDPKSKRELGVAAKEYMTLAFEKTSERSLVGSTAELRELIDNTIHRAKIYVEGIAAGHFPLVAEDLQKKACSKCGLQAACRLNEALTNNTLPKYNPASMESFWQPDQ